MKLRSKTEKQKANNRKIQREREQKHCGFEIYFPFVACVCSTTFLPNNPDIKPNKNRIEHNMKLKLTDDNCVEPKDGGRSI